MGDTASFTRRANKVLNLVITFWAITIVPLIVTGIWWSGAWVIAAMTTVIMWFTATAIAYDSRYERSRGVTSPRDPEHQ